jgi:hypothetical protein
MSEPASFAESNGVLSRPPDMTDDECAPLSILRASIGPYPAVISCWKLTAEELAEINRTGRVWLVVLGETMPPVMVEGLKPHLTESQ